MFVCSLSLLLVGCVVAWGGGGMASLGVVAGMLCVVWCFSMISGEFGIGLVWAGVQLLGSKRKEEGGSA